MLPQRPVFNWFRTGFSGHGCSQQGHIMLKVSTLD